jgi:hypothetical protein
MSRGLPYMMGMERIRMAWTGVRALSHADGSTPDTRALGRCEADGSQEEILAVAEPTVADVAVRVQPPSPDERKESRQPHLVERFAHLYHDEGAIGCDVARKGGTIFRPRRLYPHPSPPRFLIDGFWQWSAAVVGNGKKTFPGWSRRSKPGPFRWGITWRG